MKELLKKQMEFEYWANSELLVKLKEADPLNDRALLLYSHIMSVNSIWLQRLKGEPVTVNLFQERTLVNAKHYYKQTLKIGTLSLLKQRKKFFRKISNSISLLIIQ